MLNPQYQERLYEELISLYPDKVRWEEKVFEEGVWRKFSKVAFLIRQSSFSQTINYDNIKESPLLDAVLKESQRMFPALNMLFRVAENPIEIKGWKFEKGDLLAIDVFRWADLDLDWLGWIQLISFISAILLVCTTHRITGRTRKSSTQNDFWRKNSKLKMTNPGRFYRSEPVRRLLLFGEIHFLIKNNHPIRSKSLHCIENGVHSDQIPAWSNHAELRSVSIEKNARPNGLYRQSASAEL